MIITIGSAAIRGCSFFILLILSGVASAHGVTEGDQGYIQEISGTNIIPFMYLGAKHMVTGYDHLLFLIGVIFFLYRLADIGIYVTLFAIGHSSTLILGVYFDIAANAYLIDAIIGLSVAYKALDNMGAYQRWFGFQPNIENCRINIRIVSWLWARHENAGIRDLQRRTSRKPSRVQRWR